MKPTARNNLSVHPAQPLFAEPSARVLAAWLVLFTAVGVGWRVVRYALGFPFWGDEAYVCVNLLHRDYAGLLDPLEYQQIAAPLWLWIEKLCSEAFGGGEYALRLPGVAFGLLALAAFVAFARSHADPRGAALAVAIFAVTYYLARESAEVKPYPADTAVSTLILLSAGFWLTRPDGIRHALLTAALSCAAIWISYPAIFTASGVSLALMIPALRSGRRAAAAWLVYSMLIALSFAAFCYLFAARQVSSVADSWLEDYWRGAFPPLRAPAALPQWFLDIHTGLMFAYPVGGENGGSTLTTIAVLIGVAALLRTGRARLAGLLLAPFAMTFVAAAMEKYPYGKSFRVAAFLAPSICLLAGVGAAALLNSIRSLRAREIIAGGFGLMLLAFALVGMTLDVIAPYKSVEDANMRAAMRELAAALAPGDRVAAINSPYAPPGHPSCPRFHQVMYYYCELYSARRLLWREGDHLPESEWLLAYYAPDLGAEGAPALARALTDARFAPARTFRLGEGNRLEVYRLSHQTSDMPRPASP